MPGRQIHLALMRLGFRNDEILAMPDGMAAGYLVAAVDKPDAPGKPKSKTYKVRRKK